MNSKFEILESVRSGRISPEEGAFKLKEIMSQTRFYTGKWVEEVLQDKKLSGIKGLVFCDKTDKKTILEHILPESTVYVYRGNCFEVIRDNEIAINPNSSKDYEGLFTYLESRRIVLNSVLHMWNIDAEETRGNELTVCGLSVLHICKQLIVHEQKEELKFLYVYDENTEKIRTYSEAVFSIFKSIEEETTKIYGKTISVDCKATDSINKILINELADNKAGEVRYFEGRRQVKEYQNITSVRKKEIITPGKTYLIAGGSGSLGRRLTADILSRGGQVMWCGRRQVSDVKDIPKNVRYYQCDVTDEADVISLEETFSKNNALISGLFLCTGVTKDSLLKNKKIEENNIVFQSKIKAVQYFDEVFAEYTLDFIALYSSVSSAVTCMGQSDYAYANAFLNAYAKYRNNLRNRGKRSGVTLSICWPYFEDGGMKMDAAALTFMQNSKGMLPLKADQQYELLCRAYEAGMDSVVIINGNAKGLFDYKEMTVGQDNLKQSDKDYKGEVLSFLKREAAIILDEDESVFEDRGKFSRFGFDSITTIEYVNAVNKFYGIKLLPSVLYEYTKFLALAEYLIKEYPDQTASKHGGREEKDRSRKSWENNAIVSKPIENKLNDEDIAIVGMAGQFPKSKNVTEFWKHLVGQENLITEVPADRWKWEDYYGEDIFGKNKTDVIWGGFIDDIDKFDEKFFGISPKEADYMNPQQRLMLKNVWDTIEDAGYKASDLAGNNIGVFIGIAGSEYNDICVENKVEISPYSSMGLQHSVAANRISYFFDFHGPSEAIDTACSSSLVALNRAVKAMKNGECEEAIVGGVNVILTPSLYIAFDKAGMLSKTGKCSAFDKDADGFVRGEGVASIYIKPLKKALEEKDHIYGIIKGSCVNHGGDASSLTSPNTAAQSALIKKTYQEAGVEFEHVTYIETHGTGTVLGDSIEVNALKSAYNELCSGSSQAARCGLGSVKTNIGHLETAAGIAGIIKVLLSMKNNVIPGNVNFHEQSPMVQIENTPFFIVDKATEWKRLQNQEGNTIPRIAGISSFGFGGTNAHVIIEEYIKDDSGQADSRQDNGKAAIIPVSAQSETQLEILVKSISGYLKENAQVDIHDVAFTMQNGREVFPVRYAVYGRNKNELISKLDRYPNSTGISIGEGTADATDISISTVQTEKYYEDICNNFINGSDVNWKNYYKDSNARRISLPTYVFASNRHWVHTETGYKNSNNTDILTMKRVWETAPGTEARGYTGDIVILAGAYEDGVKYKEKLSGQALIATAETMEEDIGRNTGLILDIRSKKAEGEYIDIVIKACKKLFKESLKDRKGYIFAYPTSDIRAAMNGGAIESFFKALQQESTGFEYQVIGYENELIVPDNLNLNNNLVKYINGKCYTSVLKTDKFVSALHGKKSRLKNDGIYLIFGGNGGIGILTAEYILKNTTSKVVLAGRRPKTAEVTELIQKYQNRVIYKLCDINEISGLKELRLDIKNTLGDINGLIHSAGQVRDNSFNGKTMEEFHKVIASKVQGLINIDEVFKDDELDFVLLYTSVAAYYGSQGQTDYCFANRFMEEYAEYRNSLIKAGERFGETIYIGWPLWKDTGMKMPETMAKRLHVKYGMLPIETQQGIDILRTVFTTDIDSYAYVYGDEIKLPDSNAVKQAVLVGQPGDSLERQLGIYMRSLFASLVGVKEKDLRLDTTFEELGIDSLLTTQFTQVVQNSFGKVERTILFECSTIGEVVEYMLKRHKDAVEGYFNFNNTEAEKEEIYYGAQKHQYARQNDDIAIIGFDGKYADSDNLNELWEKLKAGVDMTSVVPNDRWDNRKYYSPDHEDSQNGKYYCQKAGFLREVDLFDPLFFHISPKDAELMDPQERMLLETAWNTVEKAGYNKKTISRKFNNEIAAFVGVTTHTYNLKGNEEFLKGSAGIAKSEAWSLANRISYFMNWKGPSIAVDTACSSSLTALHLACESLKSGECRMAFVGSANIYMYPTKFIYMSQMKMLSKSGVCSAFGADADGFVPGEAVGGVLIKPLKQAEADGDRIFGIIKSTAVNHDGMTNGYTVPNVKEQAKVIKKALEQSNINPETISYMEAHGTGTRLGDPIEIAGLTNAWSDYTEKRKYCAIGSVKANIGHSEACAGIASITKVLLQMKHKLLVPSIHSEVLNNRMEFDNSPFYVQHELSEWKTITDKEGNEEPRRAAISSFGAGGSNVHIIMEEYVHKKNREVKTKDTGNKVFTVSARNEKQLKAYADSILVYLGEHELNREETVKNDSSCKFLIKKALAEILSVPYGDINSQETFENCGMDRIQLHEFIEKLTREYAGKGLVCDIRLDWTIDKVTGMLDSSAKPYNTTTEYDISFDDFIFTSHLKEEFEERLAINCNSIKQLISGLISYSEGLADGQYFTHNVKQNKTSDNYTVYDIAKTWTEGNEVNWEEMDSGAEKIDFPTYPFAKESYRITTLESRNKGTISKTLDENLSTLQKQIYTKEVYKNDFYLENHIVDGKEILPGVFYLQLVNEAAKLSFSTDKAVIRDVTWLKPIIIDSSRKMIRVELEASKSGCEFKVLTGNEVHMQGKAEAAMDRVIADIRVNELENSCTGTISNDKCYEIFKKSGINYGLPFRGLKYVKYNGDYVLARISIPENTDGIEEYGLHPSILDGALQATIGLSCLYGTKEEKTFIPFGFKEMYVARKLEDECYVYISNSVIEKKMVICDISITNRYGEVLLTFNRFTFRVLETNAAKDTGEIHYHKPEWVLSTMTSVSHKEKQNILIFYNGAKLTGKLAERHNLIYVRNGEFYQKISTVEYILKPDSVRDYEKLFGDLKESGIKAEKILHLWSGDYGLDTDRNAEVYIKPGIEAVFSMCKAILSVLKDKDIEILYASITENGRSNPFFSGVGGFLKSVHLEHGSIKTHLIELEGGINAENINMLFRELDSQEKAIQIRYEDGTRYVKSVTEIPMDMTKGAGFKADNMVYLITGALGGLSNLMIQKICRDAGDAKFILTDILAPGEKSHALINQIIASGKQAEYIQADLVNPLEVNKVVEKGKERFNCINCIIHTAGIIRDEIFAKKEFETLRKVMGPKVFGTLNLEEATKNEPVRLFILFSSLAAFGNIGQCDYAYANEFLVKFEEARNIKAQMQERSGKTLVINWPLWNSGGMKTNKETERFFEHFGMKNLDSDLGMSALQIAACNDYQQVIVTQGDNERIEKKLQSMFRLREKTANISQYNDTDKSAAKLFSSQIIDFMRDILKVRDEIDVAAEISEYGFDSISITDLVNKINKLYELGVLPTQVFEYNTIERFIKNIYAQNVEAIVKFYKDSIAELSAQIPDNQPKNHNPYERVMFKEVTDTGSNRYRNEPIAIIGMSGIMPGADNLEEYWDNLITEKDVVTEIPAERWDWESIYGDSSQESNKTLVNKAGFVKHIADFDEEFFKISNREAKFMDPVQRMVLEESYHALEDGGIKKNDIYGMDTGVYIGLVSMEYYELAMENSDSIDPYLSTGNSRAVTANRLSYIYGVTGPSEVIDTACSSSLVAIERAADDIRSGKCSMAIAGGVNAILSPKVHIAYSRTGMLSPDGRCRTFDQSANGYGRGEGCGIIIMKPLKKAVEDGNHIHALLLGGAVNHTGHVNTLTTPNPNAQAEVIVKAIQEAGIPFQSVGYVETHGTGTRLGDPIEITGLKKAEDILNKAGLPHTCVLGAVKTNIGHLEGAAGIAGLLKTVMALKHNIIPANMNFIKQNEYIQLNDCVYSIADDIKTFPELTDINGSRYPRRAGVSSFGFGGVNSHVILEEYQNQYRQISDRNALHVFVVSGRAEELLNEYVQTISSWLCKNKENLVKCTGMLQGLIFTLQCKKEAYQYRLAVVFETLEDLIDKIEGYLAARGDMAANGIFFGSVSSKDRNEKVIPGAESAEELAKYFISNWEVEWSRCYFETPAVVSVPPRGLKKNRHWIDIKEKKKGSLSYTLKDIISKRIEVDEEQFSKKEKFENDMAELENISSGMMLKEFQKRGYFTNSEERYDINSIRNQLGVMTKYNRLFEELIVVLCKQEYLLTHETVVTATLEAVKLYTTDLQMQIKKFKAEHTSISKHVQFLEHCIPHLMQVFNGSIQATDILFPDSSMEWVKDIYANNPGSDYYNELVVKSVAAYVLELRSREPGRQVKILEVGAGTGGTTRGVVDKIGEMFENVTYMYTDLSNAFLRYGQTMYGRKYSFMEFKLFNVESNPLSQGFQTGEYDIIIGANVLHATRNMQNTIRNLRTVLKPSGWIIVNEITKIQAFLSLTFGLTDGWWLFEDDAVRLQGGPLLSVENWDMAFKKEGFVSVAGVDTLISKRKVSQDVVIARNKNEIIECGTKTIELKVPSVPLKQPQAISDGQQGLAAYIQNKTVACLAEILMVDADTIDISTPYSSYGVDSILGVECINTINKCLRIKLNTTDLFNYTDVRKLSEHIADVYSEDLMKDGEAAEFVNDYELSLLLDQFDKGEITIEDIAGKLEKKNE